MLIAAGAATAQTGGSSYSIFGIGDVRYLPSTRSAGMGYTGLGMPSPGYINSIQPAAWSRINRVRLEAGILYEGFKSTDGTMSLYLANSNFSGALLAIPISPANGIVAALGFTPYSNVSYNLFAHGAQDGVDYQINHSGTGGLSRGLVGLSYAPLQTLALGASFNYLFGSISNTSTLSPTDPQYAGGTSTLTTTLRGITVSFGGQFNGFGEIAEALRPFSLGFVVTTRGNLRTTRETMYSFLTEQDTIPQSNERVILPPAYGVGLAYQAGDNYLLAADYYAQPWGDASFNGENLPEIRDSHRFGIGGERLPERDATGWFGKLVYRLGFYYSATYYRINNEPINEWGATGGLAIPLFGDARLNTSFEYGKRGTTASGLVKDNVFRVSFSVSLSEPWFQRYEEE